ncbi:hypothetical protein [Levilactobacillus brevis]|uniref:hypothetical protein n=1 Tax=Levilactobacillus brevis TaxID=1580 RepID=UPI003D174772
MVEITGAFAVKIDDGIWEGKKFPFDNEQLSKLTNLILTKDASRLPSFDESIDKLIPSKRYSVKTGDSAYQLGLVESLYDFLTDSDVDLLDKLDNLIDDDARFLYDFVVYVHKDDQQFIGEIFPLTKSLIVKEKTFLHFHKTLAGTDDNSLEITSLDKAFQLPEKVNVFNFYRKIITDETTTDETTTDKTIYKIDIFDTFMFDDLMKSTNTKKSTL